eukprot:XP_013994514.1 PREDICTED: glutamate receptor ionotropic, NMDA 3A-like [Salmo salar]
MNASFNDDKLQTVAKMEKRCNVGNNHHHHQQEQPCVPWSSSESNCNCNRRKQRPQESHLEYPPCDCPLLPPQVKSPLQVTSNGRTDLVQVGLKTKTNPMLQELSELETHITIIKQQLHIAMKKKRELEQYQKTHNMTE